MDQPHVQTQFDQTALAELAQQVGSHLDGQAVVLTGHSGGQLNNQQLGLIERKSLSSPEGLELDGLDPGLAGIEFVELFDYAPVFVAAAGHPLASKPFIEAEDFRGQTLITYPVERSRLDVFSQLLIPAKVEPQAIRQVELTAVILLLVASNRGVAVLPDWVVREVKYSSDYVTRPLTAEGITRRLYAAIRSEDRDKPFMRDLIELARVEARKLQSQ